MLVVKNLPVNAGDIRDVGWNLGSGRSPGEGHGNPLHYFCLENSMDREAWWAKVHGGHKELDMTEQLTFTNTTYRTEAVTCCTKSFNFSVYFQIVLLKC